MTEASTKPDEMKLCLKLQQWQHFESKGAPGPLHLETEAGVINLGVRSGATLVAHDARQSCMHPCGWKDRPGAVALGHWCTQSDPEASMRPAEMTLSLKRSKDSACCLPIAPAASGLAPPGCRVSACPAAPSTSYLDHVTWIISCGAYHSASYLEDEA